MASLTVSKPCWTSAGGVFSPGRQKVDHTLDIGAIIILQHTEVKVDDMTGRNFQVSRSHMTDGRIRSGIYRRAIYQLPGRLQMEFSSWACMKSLTCFSVIPILIKSKVCWKMAKVVANGIPDALRFLGVFFAHVKRCATFQRFPAWIDMVTLQDTCIKAGTSRKIIHRHEHHRSNN